MIGHVPGRKHAGDRGFRGAGFGQQIAALIHWQFALEQFGRRRMADGDECAVHFNGGRLTRRRIFEREVVEHAIIARHKAFHCLVPQHFNFGIGEQAFLQDLFRPQAVTAVDQGHIVGMVGEIQRLFHRRIPTADHRHLLAAIEEPITRCAGGYALAAQLHFARSAEPLGLRTGADHQRFANIFVAAVANRAERRAVFEVDRNDGVPHHPCADMFGLRLHFLHQPRALHHLAKAGVIFDIGGDGKLAAGLKSLNNNGFQHRAGGIDRGGIARRARTDDQHFGVVGGHYDLPSSNFPTRDMGERGAIVTPPALL